MLKYGKLEAPLQPNGFVFFETSNSTTYVERCMEIGDEIKHYFTPVTGVLYDFRHFASLAEMQDFINEEDGMPQGYQPSVEELQNIKNYGTIDRFNPVS